MTTKVGVLGAGGRMGRTVCDAVTEADGLELVAEVDVDDDLDAIVDAGADVVVDFTVADAARTNLPWLAERGLHAVVGTSGITDDDLAVLGEAFTTSNCLVVANFAIGAVLSMRFAELAAPFFETA